MTDNNPGVAAHAGLTDQNDITGVTGPWLMDIKLSVSVFAINNVISKYIRLPRRRGCDMAAHVLERAMTLRPPAAPVASA